MSFTPRHPWGQISSEQKTKNTEVFSRKFPLTEDAAANIMKAGRTEELDGMF